MKKRIVSILLTMCMVLCLMPTAAFAEAAPTGTALTQENISNYKQEKNSTYSENGVYLPAGSYYLAEDIYLVGDDADPNSAWPLIISEGDVTLDLNGHVLDLKKQNISIYSNGNLTLTDSSPEAEHKFRVEDSGLWVLDETQGTETVTGGVITGGTGVDGSGATGTLGGGVSVSYGSLTMNGGSLVGCTANNGGGVSVSYGSFTMNSGRIAGCTAVKPGNAYGNGGGVYVGDSATFNMNDGSIVGCTADGGGVFVDDSATFTMNDGSIENCTADIGGGVYVGNLATFNMNDGSIKDCTADIGGGVYMGGLVTFNMTGGNIESCTADSGGGVFVDGSATFTMNDGSIENCTADIGGGVYVGNSSTFNMNDGSIVGCTADNGGGVYVGSGARFEMKSGGEGKNPTIKNCIAVRAGGGVFVDGSATFTMNDGSIEDCKASGAANAVHADGNFKGAAKNNIPKAQLTGINGGHTGSETDPILIGSAEGLEDFRNRVNKWETTLCAKLVCDIVLNDGTFDENGTYTGANGSTSAEPWTPIGTGSDPYTGTFDGDGHTIKGLYINRDESGIGLFGIVSNATIKNLTVTGYVKGYGSVGGIVGEILEEGNATIQNCANYCEVTGDTYVGGIVGYIGYNTKGDIRNCANYCEVTGDTYVGGIVGYIGYNTKGDIRNCANFGTVKGTCTDSYAYVGGIVGRASIGQEMTVVCTACYNVGTVKAKKCAGGLLGYGSMKMDSCYNVGLVEGEEFIGGLVGSALWLIIDGTGMSLVTVDNCYYLDTATKAFGEARFFAGDTSAWCKSKTQFADGTVLNLLKQNDTSGAWGKCGYLAAAGMTLPLLDWQTADAHTHDYQWKYNNTEHWKECSCGFIEQGSNAAHKEVTGICTDGIKCECGYEMHTATGWHDYPEDWTAVRPGSTHIKACRNPGCGVRQSNSCTGGTATCKEQATCEVCGEGYGALANHSFTAETAENQYLKSAATCAEQAVYYKSCAVCGLTSEGTTNEATFQSGGVLGHDFGAWTSNGDGTHTRTCTRDAQHTETDNCSGGTADCTHQATCSTCGEKYGAVDPSNHTGTAVWIPTATTHVKKYSCCDAIEVAETAHHWENGVCTECGYGCAHSGGEASCTSQAVCTVCGHPYGDLNPHDFTAENTDEKYLKTAATCTEQAVYYKSCAVCGLSSASTADEATFQSGDALDHDYGAWTSNGDGTHTRTCTRDAQHTETKACSGGTATCVDKATCEVCGAHYGAVAASNHTGGTATCKDKAVCEICGESYGELDSNNHADMKHIEAKAATKTAEGNIEYWYCEGCGKYFADKNGNKEITKADTVTAKLPDDSQSPQTGDNSNLMLWIALLFISGGAVTVTTVVSKKKRHS